MHLSVSRLRLFSLLHKASFSGMGFFSITAVLLPINMRRNEDEKALPLNVGVVAIEDEGDNEFTIEVLMIASLMSPNERLLCAIAGLLPALASDLWFMF